MKNKLSIEGLTGIFILFVILLTCLLLISPVSADDIIITNTTTETTIQWMFTNTTVLGVDNMTIDGYKLCNFDPYASTFILSDLEPSTSHEIIIYSNSTYASQTTFTKENLIAFLLKYYLVQFIGLIIVIISLTNRIVILAWLGVFITGIGFILTMPQSVSSYFYIITNGVLLLFTFLIAALESKGG